jgi:hypothetical protein
MGTADAVTVAVEDERVDVVDRRSVHLRPRGGRAFPYHAAMDAPPDERDAIIAAGLEAAELKATDAVAALGADLEFEAIGVVISRGVRHIPLEKVLTSSRLFHMAEATVYQQALRAAANNLGLPCTIVAFNDAENHDLWPVVSALGKALGPPWRKDQKFAAVAACLAAADLRHNRN